MFFVSLQETESSFQRRAVRLKKWLLGTRGPIGLAAKRNTTGWCQVILLFTTPCAQDYTIPSIFGKALNHRPSGCLTVFKSRTTYKRYDKLTSEKGWFVLSDGPRIWWVLLFDWFLSLPCDFGNVSFILCWAQPSKLGLFQTRGHVKDVWNTRMKLMGHWSFYTSLLWKHWSLHHFRSNVGFSRWSYWEGCTTGVAVMEVNSSSEAWEPARSLGNTFECVAGVTWRQQRIMHWWSQAWQGKLPGMKEERHPKIAIQLLVTYIGYRIELKRLWGPLTSLTDLTTTRCWLLGCLPNKLAQSCQVKKPTEHVLFNWTETQRLSPALFNHKTLQKASNIIWIYHMFSIIQWYVLKATCYLLTWSKRVSELGGIMQAAFDYQPHPPNCGFRVYDLERSGACRQVSRAQVRGDFCVGRMRRGGCFVFVDCRL